MKINQQKENNQNGAIKMEESGKNIYLDAL